MKPRILITAIFTATLFAAQLRAPAQNPAAPVARAAVTLGESSQYSTATNKAQRFMDYIQLSADDATLPLTLNILNGNNLSPGFSWVRVSVAGKTLFTKNNVASMKEIPFSVTGLIGAGTTQIVVEAGGISGSTMSWKLVGAQVAPVLSNGKPDKAGQGDTITLTGSHFGSKPTANTVRVGGTKAEVKSASETSLDIVVPANTKPGDNKVTVTTSGATSNSITIVVVAVPELEDLSLESAPPGQELTISGRNFSPKPSENVVTIAGATAEVTSASTGSLTVIIPEVYNPQYAIPVTVEVNGVKAKNSLTMDIYNRVY